MRFWNRELYNMCSKIKKYCQENGVDVEVQPLAFGQLEGAKAEADLIVSVTPGVKVDTDIPVISGVPFLTGVGQQEVLKKVIEILKRRINNGWTT